MADPFFTVELVLAAGVGAVSILTPPVAYGISVARRRAARRANTRALEAVPPFGIHTRPREGERVRVEGRVQAFGHAPLIARMSGRPCVFWRVSWFTHPRDPREAGHECHEWAGTSFAVATEAGLVHVDLGAITAANGAGGKLVVRGAPAVSGERPIEDPAFLDAWYASGIEGGVRNTHASFDERAVEIGARVTVVGTASWETDTAGDALGADAAHYRTRPERLVLAPGGEDAPLFVVVR